MVELYYSEYLTMPVSTTSQYTKARTDFKHVHQKKNMIYFTYLDRKQR